MLFALDICVIHVKYQIGLGFEIFKVCGSHLVTMSSIFTMMEHNMNIIWVTLLCVDIIFYEYDTSILRIVIDSQVYIYEHFELFWKAVDVA